MIDLLTRLHGRLEFQTDRPGFEAPMVLEGLRLPMVMRKHRTEVDASGFALPPIGPFKVRWPADSPNAIELDNTITVTRKARGIGRLDADGKLEIPIDLRFEHSLPAGASMLSVVLTTETSAGPPFSLQGRRLEPGATPVTARIVAVATFSGGELAGTVCAIAIEGHFDKSPFD